MKNLRTICLLLAVVMVLSLTLAGCAEKESDAPASKPSATQPDAQIPDGDDIPEQGGELPDVSEPPGYDPEGPEPTLPPVSSEIPEPDEDIDEEYRGGVHEKSYQNGYIGIACELDDDWQIYSDQLGAASTGHTQFYDMRAENMKNSSSMHITLSNLTRLEQSAYQNASDEEVVDIALMGSSVHIEGYNQAGITVKSMEKGQFTFLGEEQWCVYTVGDMLGANYHIVQIFAYDIGPVGATITVAGFSRQTVQEILSLFQPFTP